MPLVTGLMDWLFDRIYHVEDLAPAEDDVVFRVCFHRHRGPTVVLADGTRVTKGDPVAELHLRTDRLRRIHASHDDLGHVGLEFYRLIRVSMQALADAWLSDPRFEGISAAFGVNLFPEPTTRIGFEIRPVMPPWRRRLLSWWIRRIVASAHPQGAERVVVDGRPREVAEIWISQEACCQRFGVGRR